MKKTAVIYWSGTGNTEAMANAVLEGMTAAGADAKLLTVDQVNTAGLNGYAAIAFGCPAMGSEVLEEMEFQPMFDACKNCLGGKAVALFGSYGWGDGEWMRSWEKDCADAGVNLVCDSVICCEAPDDTALDALRAMGKTLAECPPLCSCAAACGSAGRRCCRCWPFSSPQRCYTDEKHPLGQAA